MSQKSSKYLDIFFDWERKEFIIQFFSREQARAYQSKNPEARIVPTDPKSAWLPIPDGMTHLRASSFGFVIRFKDNPAKAEQWRSRSILGRVTDSTRRDNTEIYLKRDWNEDDLNALLKTTRKAKERAEGGAQRGQKLFAGVADDRMFSKNEDKN